MFPTLPTAGRPRLSKKPSQYPVLAFHLVRLGQLLSSLIVSSVLIFFAHHLRIGHFYIPWTFILLLTVSILTILVLLVTTFSHIIGTLTAAHNLKANLPLLILWILGFSLLSWNLGWLLGHRCLTSNWNNEAGVMICRLYKALTAFTVTGLFSTMLAVLLDLRTHRQSTRSGTYNQMLDIKRPTDIRSSSPFHGDSDLHPAASSGQEPSPYGRGRDPSYDIARPYKVQKPIEAQQFGYSQPSEQTSYGGGGGAGWL